MKTIQIKDYTILVDDEDYDRVMCKSWYVAANGYVRHKSTDGSFFLHRYILNYAGELPIDHIDRNPRNNCKSNLRIVEPWVNNLNSKLHSTNTSGHKGVYKTAIGKYSARISVKDRSRHLGTFNTLEEAVKARQEFERTMMEDPSIRDKQFPELARNNKTGITGVSFNNRMGRWKAKIDQEHLGYFKTKEEAVRARKRAEELEETLWSMEDGKGKIGDIV